MSRDEMIEAVDVLRKIKAHCRKARCNTCEFGYAHENDCTLGSSPTNWSGQIPIQTIKTKDSEFIETMMI